MRAVPPEQVSSASAQNAYETCDAFRPCALCARAGATCVDDSGAAGPPPDATERDATPQLPPARARLQHDLPPPKRQRRTTWADGAAERASVPRSQTATGTLEQTPRTPDHGTSHDAGDDHGDSSIMIAKDIYRLESRELNEVTVNAIPGADLPQSTSTSGVHRPVKRSPISSHLAHALPPHDEILILLEEYFRSVHWFSLVILEPRFRAHFDQVKDGFAKPSEKLFLLLLSTMLGLAAWYRSHTQRDRDGSARQHWQAWSRKLIANAEQQITQLLDQSSILAIQILTLLGSFYVYQGRPSLSFSLLGATVKAAQAARLHQERQRLSPLDAEERKRVWWTIYTWDRFASITYGRPLGINDKDCNVDMPGDVYENIVFQPSAPTDSYPAKSVCFSAYQRSLNGLYLLASPAIERLYSARESESPRAAEEYVAVLETVTGKLWRWRQHLQDELSLDVDCTCVPMEEPGERAHHLQSLSLHLTFESLQIILHRPFLKQQLRIMQTGLTPQSSVSVPTDFGMHRPSSVNALASSTSPEAPVNMETSSPREWWEAAIRIARTTELLDLTQAATDTHLVSFLALNLFNAAIVMIVLALSDPLNNRAQQAKRAVARIYRLQITLGSRSRLSEQSSQVIHSLTELLLRREREAILEPLAPALPHAADPTAPGEPASGARRPSTYQPSVVQSPAGFDGRLRQDWLGPGSDGANLATRLDSSLASVQRVFTAGPHAARDERSQPTSSSDGTHQHNAASAGAQTYDFGYRAHPDERQPGIPGLPADMDDWSGADFNLSEGVGWFWDPAWDALEDAHP
ncbi:hypothetical protein LTR53_008962 [Teratosphaeriaceae sp. CCFEE 6253]|nr:hypothetical protein LTR53_008962 [Teratosphaeriaceae sp. CCFEE 6253]